MIVKARHSARILPGSPAGPGTACSASFHKDLANNAGLSHKTQDSASEYILSSRREAP